MDSYAYFAARIFKERTDLKFSEDSQKLTSFHFFFSQAERLHCVNEINTEAILFSREETYFFLLFQTKSFTDYRNQKEMYWLRVYFEKEDR